MDMSRLKSPHQSTGSFWVLGGMMTALHNVTNNHLWLAPMGFLLWERKVWSAWTLVPRAHQQFQSSSRNKNTYQPATQVQDKGCHSWSRSKRSILQCSAGHLDSSLVLSSMHSSKPRVEKQCVAVVLEKASSMEVSCVRAYSLGT